MITGNCVTELRRCSHRQGGHERNPNSIQPRERLFISDSYCLA